jgi:hypothetical protein
MKRFDIGILLVIITLPCARTVGAQAALNSDSAASNSAFTVTMRPVERSAGAAHASNSNAQRADGRYTLDDFSFRGAVIVGGVRRDIYLVSSSEYTVQNRANDFMSNKSSVIAVDQLGNGKIPFNEGRHANQPLRIGDRMFRVVAIAHDGSSITLKPASEPLESLVVGLKCPDFAYTTLSGRKVSADSFKGKALLIDVWSFT